MRARVFEDSKEIPLEILVPKEIPTSIVCPLYLERVPAGFPSPAEEFIDSKLDLNEYLVAHPAATFYARVSGHSMIGAGIHPGDILIVDRSLEAKHDDIVVAVVENELTVKRLYQSRGCVELRSENPDYPPLTFSENSSLIIWGVVTGVTRHYKR
jgi:DNA polymerase V